MAGEKVLIVEDDPNLLATLKYNLQKEGYIVTAAEDGRQAVEEARVKKPDLIILDLMLPELSGLDVCRILRHEMTVPIIILTAKAEEVDKILGLEIGADDYMTKPFSMRELIARVHAALRRADIRNEPIDDKQVLSFGQVTIDPARHLVLRDGTPLEMTPKEYDLLVFLARNISLVFNREQLLEKVWGYDYGGDTRTVDVHIRWLRKKIEADPQEPRHIITVRGTGYKLEG